MWRCPPSPTAVPAPSATGGGPRCAARRSACRSGRLRGRGAASVRRQLGLRGTHGGEGRAGGPDPEGHPADVRRADRLRGPDRRRSGPEPGPGRPRRHRPRHWHGRHRPQRHPGRAARGRPADRRGRLQSGQGGRGPPVRRDALPDLDGRGKDILPTAPTTPSSASDASNSSVRQSTCSTGTARRSSSASPRRRPRRPSSSPRCTSTSPFSAAATARPVPSGTSPSTPSCTAKAGCSWTNW